MVKEREIILFLKPIQGYGSSKMVFLTIESANKAEINILSARDTTRPGPWARASWVMMQWYIRGSIALSVHLGLRTNRPLLTDDKFILV